jgi:hypothetical protein
MSSMSVNDFSMIANNPTSQREIKSYRHLVGGKYSDYIPPGLRVQRTLISSFDVAEGLGKAELIAHAEA